MTNEGKTTTNKYTEKWIKTPTLVKDDYVCWIEEAWETVRKDGSVMSYMGDRRIEGIVVRQWLEDGKVKIGVNVLHCKGRDAALILKQGFVDRLNPNIYYSNATRRRVWINEEERQEAERMINGPITSKK